MKKNLLFLLLMFSALCVRAQEVPTLLLLTTLSQEISIPIASIQKITYDQEGLATMYVLTTTGTQTYALSDIQKMTLTNIPQSTDLSTVQAGDEAGVQKILIHGNVYILKDGKLYTMKGESL